jgi:hypothetical protein
VIDTDAPAYPVGVDIVNHRGGDSDGRLSKKRRYRWLLQKRQHLTAERFVLTRLPQKRGPLFCRTLQRRVIEPFERTPAVGGHEWREGILLLKSQFPKEPGPGHLPVPHHGFRRYVERFGGLFHAQPSEEPHLNHTAFPLVVFGQCLQRVVEGD